MDSRPHRASLALLVAMLTLLAAASPASAASLTLNGSGALSFAGGATEVNDVTITNTGAAYVVRDDAVSSMSFTQTGGLPCSILGLFEISCPAASVSTINVALGDDADSLDAGGVAVPMNVAGDGGEDTIATGSGADVIAGGTGSDTFVGGAGADTVAGGSGKDTVDYSAASSPVTADNDGVADDGLAGEGDNLAPDVDHLIGGSAADVLSGGSELDGRDGSDTLTAGALGGAILAGGAGDDLLTGGPNLDEFRGGPGVDRILARDGLAEWVSCGEELDVLELDAIDLYTADCEVPPAPAPGGEAPPTGDDGFGPRPGAPLPPARDILLPANPVATTATPGVVSVQVGCAATAQEDCEGVAILELNRRVLRPGSRVIAARGRYVVRQQRAGRRRFRAGPGKQISVRIRLNQRGHAILRNRRRARGRIRIRQLNRAGEAIGETTRPVTFTARKWGRRKSRRR